MRFIFFIFILLFSSTQSYGGNPPVLLMREIFDNTQHIEQVLHQKQSFGPTSLFRANTLSFMNTRISKTDNYESFPLFFKSYIVTSKIPEKKILLIGKDTSGLELFMSFVKDRGENPIIRIGALSSHDIDALKKNQASLIISLENLNQKIRYTIQDPIEVLFSQNAFYKGLELSDLTTHTFKATHPYGVTVDIEIGRLLTLGSTYNLFTFINQLVAKLNLTFF